MNEVRPPRYPLQLPLEELYAGKIAPEDPGCDGIDQVNFSQPLFPRSQVQGLPARAVSGRAGTSYPEKSG